MMTDKKVIHLRKGDVEIALSPIAFAPKEIVTNDGNNAENIDELLYIKRPQNGFPQF